MRGPRGSRQAHPRLARGVGLFLLGVALAAVVYPLWWAHRSAAGGHALLQPSAYTETTASRLGSGQSRCPAGPREGPPRVTPGRAGLLQIPAIGLRAPVLDGLSNAVLAVAVGHDPATVWPGAAGESILLAHDVSYFSALSQVRPGALVIWTWGCEQATFRVISAEVAKPGARIAVPPAGSGLALVTCWPTNALFWTPYRYVLETVLIRQQNVTRPGSPAVVTPLDPLVVPAPPALVAEGLSINEVGIPVGRLTVAGAPSPAFRQGPQPLAVEIAALRDYAAVDKTAQAANRIWWTDLAVAGVPLPVPWSFRYTTNVTLVVEGSTVTRVIIGSVAATVTLVVDGGTLYVQSITR